MGRARGPGLQPRWRRGTRFVRDPGTDHHPQDVPHDGVGFCAVVPCDIDGGESEGAAATYVPRTGSVAYALNLGTQVPSNGTTVVCHAVGGRWCFRYDG